MGSVWDNALRDGALLALVASAYVMMALRSNPRLFLRHYPAKIRAAAPPLTPQESRRAKLVGLPFVLLLVAGPLLSSLRLAHAEPAATPLGLGLNAFLVLEVFNAVDLVLLDIVWLCWLRPRWAMIPGAEHVPFQPNYLDHVRGFVSGTVMAALVGGLAAALVPLFA